MRILFADLAAWDYDVDTPGERALGGMQSAACHLAVALAADGHDVALLTGTARPGLRRGVHCLAAADPRTPELLAAFGFDAAVSLQAARTGWRERLAPGTPVLLWTGHADDQDAVAALADPDVRSVFDGFVFVGEWQRRRFAARFGIEEARAAVIGNAVAPAFERLFSSRDDLAAAKARPPVLAYTSTPFRGLELLLAMMPRLSADCVLDVYSGLSTYDVAPADDPFAALYRRAAETPRVRYVGPLPQPALALALRPASLLAYPCIFAETFCISALEAMAAGCLVVTTDLGALAQTTAGRAVLVPMDGGLPAAMHRYLGALDDAVGRAGAPETLDRLWEQVGWVNATGTWAVRAREWADLLSRANAVL
ncbi:glycosyltransferase family 4 protein [Arenibaculum sp.]|uniref:glycosyltransferase family 4 protein n=1 Tax=Arenibaculum sp. TaxID=2865862 RepID=UPI002E111A0F|nr:glycosyltransferase family 4 protein [Arenibaculum sp.]